MQVWIDVLSRIGMNIEVCHVSEKGQAPATRGTKRGRKSNAQNLSQAPPTKKTKTDNDTAPALTRMKSKSKTKVEVESEAEGSNGTEPESEDEEDQLSASQYLDTGLQQKQRSVPPVGHPRLPIAEESQSAEAARATSTASISVPVPARPPSPVPLAPVSASVSVVIPPRRPPGRPRGSGKKRAQPAEESDDDYVPPKMVQTGSLNVQGTKRTRRPTSRLTDGAS